MKSIDYYHKLITEININTKHLSELYQTFANLIDYEYKYQLCHEKFLPLKSELVDLSYTSWLLESCIVRELEFEDCITSHILALRKYIEELQSGKHILEFAINELSKSRKFRDPTFKFFKSGKITSYLIQLIKLEANLYSIVKTPLFQQADTGHFYLKCQELELLRNKIAL